MIYLTGSSGFIGKAILQRLETSKSTTYIILPRDMVSTIKLIPSENSTIINCSWAGVLGSDRDSEIQYQNERYINSLADFAIANKVNHVISFGSQAEYGNLTIPSRETFPVCPLTLYAKMKVRCHNLLLSKLSRHDIALTWLRLYDPYGPGDNPKWFLPYVVNCALNNISPKLTACTQTWDYIYISDVVNLVMKVLYSRPAVSSVYNVSSFKPIRLRQVVETVFDLVQPSVALPDFGAVPFRNGQQFFVSGCNDKARKNFSWSPVTPIEEGLRLTIESMKLSKPQ
jgi:UDP-glucose 4-epimerase